MSKYDETLIEVKEISTGESLGFLPVPEYAIVEAKKGNGDWLMTYSVGFSPFQTQLCFLLTIVNAEKELYLYSYAYPISMIERISDFMYHSELENKRCH